MRVLIVEDDPVTQRLFGQILAERGHEVMTCGDAESAWDLCQEQIFPLMILDWLLPGMDGLELCRRVRTLPHGDRSIVLVATVREGRDQLEAVLEAGADDYLSKPVSLGLLKIRLAIAERQVTHLEERKRAEAELARSHEDVLALLDGLRPGTALTDSDGALTFLNQTARTLFGEDGIVGRHWEKVFALRAGDLERLRAMAAKPQEGRARLSTQVNGPQGRQFWVDVDVQDDPRDRRRKIFLFYDMSEVYDLRRQLNEKAQFRDLVGKSKPMQQVYEQIRQLSKVDATVLIEGDTGTGKELVARALHDLSHRSAKPFIAVNCAGLTDSLIGSQLFGHRRGSFTGAVEDHIGFLESAQGGTLFLDEIGDIPMGMQASLLRVLQEREIMRLGETKTRKIDVRILAATHRDLGEEAAEGRFRQDLLYRIRVARVLLPPLSQRREDIPLLVAAFLRKTTAVTGKEVRELTQEAMTLLMDHHWPGNVRELENAIEYAAIHAPQEFIRPEDLPPETQADAARPVGAASPSASLPPAPVDERQTLLDALERANGNRTAAARLMGISRATLYRRMTSMGLGVDASS